MKKFINKVENVELEMLEGIAKAHLARKTRSNADFTGKNFRIARDEQHIVESQSFCLYSVC